jgi:hypothetical protein
MKHFLWDEVESAVETKRHEVEVKSERTGGSVEKGGTRQGL